MNSSMTVLVILLVVAMAVATLAALKTAKRHEATYRARQPMTDNELEFFGRLVKAVPEHFIFPQVAMSAILQTTETDRKKAYGDHLRIAQQRVDYLVCRADGSIVAVVELDDKTHQAAKDKVRDERLHQAGIRTLRFESRRKPAVPALRDALIPPPAVETPRAAPPTLHAVPAAVAQT